MQSNEDIKKKLDSTTTLKSIVRTMKIIAAVNIRSYDSNLKTLSEYNETIEMGLQVVLKSFEEEELILINKKKSKVGVIIFGSELGLCGQFNEQIVNYAYGKIKEFKEKEKDVLTLGIGEKVLTKIEDFGYKVDNSIFFPSGLLSNAAPILNEILTIIEAWQDNYDVHEVLFFYNKPAESQISYKPHTDRLLPVDSEYLMNLRNKKWKSRSIPIFKTDKYSLFKSLIRNHLFVVLYRSFIESLASENAARLVSMQAAEKHINEHFLELKDQFNNLRQELITSELLDIIAGFETLNIKKTKKY